MNMAKEILYFSLMEFLEVLYTQELPGNNENSKNDYFSIMNTYLQEYSKSLNKKEFEEILSKASQLSKRDFGDVSNHYKAIHSYKTRRWLFGNKNLYPLLVDSLKYTNNYVSELFTFDENKKLEVISSIINQNSGKKDLYEKTVNKERRSGKYCSSVLDGVIEKEAAYSRLETKNIAICATMSAGKSTLVNALLGNDVLPARNEATTAKITSVYDKDGLKVLKGFCKRDQERIFSYNLNLQTLDSWNSDNKIEHIYIQGDMDGIKNTEKYALAVHDTPGTNNSLDHSHYKTTMDFLKNEKIDLLIYVANFEQMLTNDEQFLLKEIYSKVIKIKKIPMLFVINKVDSYDKQKEDYNEVIRKVSLNLEALGFNQYQILPVAAKPARLIKMALCGKSSQFSEKECDGFSSIVNKFTKRININEISSKKVTYEDSLIYGNEDSDTIVIDGESFELEKLRQALVNTGLIGIEKIIEEYIE